MKIGVSPIWRRLRIHKGCKIAAQAGDLESGFRGRLSRARRRMTSLTWSRRKSPPWRNKGPAKMTECGLSRTMTSARITPIRESSRPT